MPACVSRASTQPLAPPLPWPAGSSGIPATTETRQPWFATRLSQSSVSS